MKNTRKLLAMLLLLALLAVSLFATACNTPAESASETASETESETESTAATESETQTSDGKVLYTITVVDKDGNPLANYVVQICDAAPNGTCLMPGTTDANGVYSKRLDAAKEWKARLLFYDENDNEIPGEYVYFEGTTDITITVEEA